MQRSQEAAAQRSTIERQDLDRLFEVLRARGYTVMGPVARDGAVVWDEVSTAGELPAGWTSEQEPGRKLAVLAVTPAAIHHDLLRRRTHRQDGSKPVLRSVRIQEIRRRNVSVLILRRITRVHKNDQLRVATWVAEELLHLVAVHERQSLRLEACRQTGRYAAG